MRSARRHAANSIGWVVVVLFVGAAVTALVILGFEKPALQGPSWMVYLSDRIPDLQCNSTAGHRERINAMKPLLIAGSILGLVLTIVPAMQGIEGDIEFHDSG